MSEKSQSAPSAPPETAASVSSSSAAHHLHAKAILRDMAISAGLDVVAFMALPIIKKLAGKLKPEHADDIAKAKEHFTKGEVAQGMEVLHTVAFGIGMFDEQIEDYDFTGILIEEKDEDKRNRLSVQLRSLEEWLASDRGIRQGFRHSITLEPDPKKRRDLIKDYAELNDAQRLQRLISHGKLDPGVLHQFLNVAAEPILEFTNPQSNGLSRVASKIHSSLFTSIARFFIR